MDGANAISGNAVIGGVCQVDMPRNADSLHIFASLRAPPPIRAQKKHSRVNKPHTPYLLEVMHWRTVIKQGKPCPIPPSHIQPILGGFPKKRATFLPSPDFVSPFLLSRRPPFIHGPSIFSRLGVSRSFDPYLVCPRPAGSKD